MGDDHIFTQGILRWAANNTRTFLWREPGRPPFQILVAEMLLRKTRAESVEPIYEKVIARYPSAETMASADERELEELITPLGLFRIRTRALKDVARTLSSHFGGDAPREAEDLNQLPHVGRYIANAVRCFAHGERAPLVDANVQRVFVRYFSMEPAVEIHKADYLWDKARTLLPTESVRSFNLGILDFAAAICVPGKPRCEECPIGDGCDHFQHSVNTQPQGD